jgi:hypothetical protein
LHFKARGFSPAKQWDAAHNALQLGSDPDTAWVHAYLHRKEGDASNAAYWYRRAGKPIATETLTDEWQQIVQALLVSTSFLP